MPATAATRIHRPTSTPSPMATSPDGDDQPHGRGDGDQMD